MTIPHAFDKLILAPSRQPGAPLVAAELYARGYHAHEDQLGAILYYELADVPLLHGLGYHNRAAEQANLLLSPPGSLSRIRPPPSRRACGRRRLCRPKGCGDLSRTWPGKRTGRQLRHFDKLTFRVAEESPVDLYRGEPPPQRSQGPARLLDDFRAGAVGTAAANDGSRLGAGQSGAAGLECRRGANFVWRRGWTPRFRSADYDHFKFDWKLEGVEQGWSKSLIFRVDASPTDFHVLLRPQAAACSARAETRGGDQYGELRRGRLVHRRHPAAAADGPAPRGGLARGRRSDARPTGRRLDGRSALAPLRPAAVRPRLVRRPRPPPPAGLARPGPRPLARGRDGPALVGRRAVHGLRKAEIESGPARPIRHPAGAASARDEPASLAAGIKLRPSDRGRLDLHLALPAGAVDLQIDPDGRWEVARPR